MHHGVTADRAYAVQCPACGAQPDLACEYTSGSVAGQEMTLFHASRYLAGRPPDCTNGKEACE